MHVTSTEVPPLLTPHSMLCHQPFKRLALLRLEQEGDVASEWGASENNRRAKYYRLTRAGHKRVESETREWRQTAAILARFFAPVEP